MPKQMMFVSSKRPWIAPGALRRIRMVLPLCLCRLDRPLYGDEIAMGDEPMAWTAIKPHIGAVRSLKDSDNGSTATFREITVFVEDANAIAHLKAVR